MVAQEIEVSSDPAQVVSPVRALEVVPTATDPDAEVREAERSLLHAATVGALVGMALGAVVWVGLVALGLALTGASYDVAAWLAMAAGVGVFAGAFLGSWAGVTATADRMDEVANRRG
jgi:hypothetical protein